MPESVKNIGLVTAKPELQRHASEVADRYSFHRLDKAPDSGLFLFLGQDGLELRQGGQQAPGPVRVDFVGGSAGHRRRFGGGRGQALARAVGMKAGFSPGIWDATAGLGRDGFVLASLGSPVTLCERSPVLAALLEDGLHRATGDSEIGGWVSQRLKLVHGDSAILLQSLPENQLPQVVYLDPMYPPGKDHVQVKKEMRALQQLLGPDCDSDALLAAALKSATRRVVVKRPKRAGWLSGLKPAASIESKKTRYDVYVTLQGR